MLIGAIVGILIVAVFPSAIFWLVAKLGLGIEVSGFGAAFLTAIASAR